MKIYCELHHFSSNLENIEKTDSRCLSWNICLTYEVIVRDKGSNISVMAT